MGFGELRRVRRADILTGREQIWCTSATETKSVNHQAHGLDHVPISRGGAKKGFRRGVPGV